MVLRITLYISIELSYELVFIFVFQVIQDIWAKQNSEEEDGEDVGHFTEGSMASHHLLVS